MLTLMGEVLAAMPGVGTDLGFRLWELGWEVRGSSGCLSVVAVEQQQLGCADAGP